MAIGSMIESMIRKLPGAEIHKVILVGNTPMQLIFSNFDVSPLSVYPFYTDNIGWKTFDPKELGWHFKIKEKIQFCPSVGGFVGSDILAGIAATGLYKKENYTALIDLGTNGEIAVGNKYQILCASTAAGPAFEGTNISMGMRASTGAISSLNYSNGKMEAEVIGNTTPKGICGSGIIDAIAILRKLELIGIFGEISSGDSEVNLAGKVQLTQKDIYEFLLAKAALAAGITILANKLAIDIQDISEIYIAGAFGNYINIENVVSTGMIEMHESKIHKRGNTALIGAKMFLFSKGEIIQQIRSITKHVNLESEPDFQNIYVEKMQFQGL